LLEKIRLFPSHMCTYRMALNSICAALSHTLVYAGRPRIPGHCIVQVSLYSPAFTGDVFIAPTHGGRARLS